MLKLTRTITCEIDKEKLQDIARDIYEVMETDGDPFTVEYILLNLDSILDLETNDGDEVPTWILGIENLELLAKALIPYLNAFKLLSNKE